MDSDSYEVYEMLRDEGLEAFFLPFQNRLHVQKIQDFRNVLRQDLSLIGILSGPDIKRFEKVSEKVPKSGGFKDIFNKVFKGKPKVTQLLPAALQSQQEPVIIKTDDVIIGKELGKGQFGTVNEGVWQRKVTGKIVKIPVAIKSLGGNFGLNEVSNLTSLDQQHDNIIKFYGIIVSGDAPFKMVTEFAPLGSLLSRLHDGDIKSISMLSQFGVQIASGMVYLESKNLVHRDLAARNILVMAYNQVKVSDFGLSKLLNSNKEWIMEVEERLPIRWLAPECLLEGKFTNASDVWSFGVVLWEMFSLGQMPWENLNSSEVINNIQNGVQLSEPANCPRFIYPYVMQNCWKFKADERCNFEQVREKLTSLQPTTGVAWTNQVTAATLKYGIDDWITAIKPIGGNADLWLGQNETTGDIGPFMKTATRPLFGKIFSTNFEERNVISKPHLLDIPHGERGDGYCSDSECSSLERKRSQSNCERRRSIPDVIPFNQRPLSDSQLEEKLNEMIESGHYAYPRSVSIFDDDDDYVTMKEFLNKGLETRKESLDPIVLQTDINQESPINDGVSGIAVSSKQQHDKIRPRIKPKPPPKPKRTFLTTSSQHHDLFMQSETGPNAKLSNQVINRIKTTKENSKLDGDESPTEVVWTKTDNAESAFGTNPVPEYTKVNKSRQSKQNQVSLSTRYGISTEIKTDQLMENPGPNATRKKNKRLDSFSITEVEAMLSEVQLMQFSEKRATLKDCKEDDDKFIERISPYSTIGRVEKEVERSTKEISGEFDQSMEDEEPHYSYAWHISHNSDNKSIGYQDVKEDKLETVSLLSQASGRYESPRFYEGNGNGVQSPTTMNDVINPPLVKPRQWQVREISKGAHTYLLRSPGLGEGEINHVPADQPAQQEKHRLEASISNPMPYKQPITLGLQGASTEAVLPNGTLAQEINTHPPIRERARSFDPSPGEGNGNNQKDVLATSPPDYSSYSAISRSRTNTDSTETISTITPSCFKGITKIARRSSRSKMEDDYHPDMASGSWEPTLVRVNPSGTTNRDMMVKQMKTTSKKKVRKSSDPDSSRRGRIVTLEQIPKLASFIQQNVPDLGAITHSELCGSLELTKGNIEEAIHYLKYRRLLDYGLNVNGEMALDALEHCQWDLRESIRYLTLIHVVNIFTTVDVDYVRQVLTENDWDHEQVVRRLTLEQYIGTCQEMSVAENEAKVALRFAKGDTEKAIRLLKARRIADIVGKTEDHCWNVLSHCQWDMDRAVDYILNSSEFL